MPRIPELESSQASASIQKAMHAQEQQFGFVLNPTKIMGYCPDVVHATAKLGQALDESGHIDPALRHLVYAKVASLNGCPF